MTRLFVQRLAHNKEKITGPFYENTIVSGWFPSQRANNAESVSCHDVVIISSIYAVYMWNYKPDHNFYRAN